MPAIDLDRGSRHTDLDLETQVRRTPGALRVHAAGLTDTGRVRPRNEDQFLIATLTKALQVQQSSFPQARLRYADDIGWLFIVADGVGGSLGGEHASATAVDAIEEFALNTLKWFFRLKGDEGQKVLAEFRDALQQTDARLCREAAARPELRGMGTTLTMAFSVKGDLFVAHVGDSRCYLHRDGTLNQITNDHTLVQELVRRGHLSAEEARGNRLRHVITNVVGGDSPGVQPELHKARLEAGDVLLLCSDGLTEMVPDEGIAAVLRDEPDPRRASERLVREANEAGGKDNITAVVARYEQTA